MLDKQVAKVIWQRPHRTPSPWPWRTRTVCVPRVSIPNRTLIRSDVFAQPTRVTETDRQFLGSSTAIVFISCIQCKFCMMKHNKCGMARLQYAHSKLTTVVTLMNRVNYKTVNNESINSACEHLILNDY